MVIGMTPISLKPVQNSVEKFRQIQIHHIPLPPGHDLTCRLHRLALVPPGAEAVAVSGEQRLEDRFQQLLQGGVHHPVTHRRHPE